MINKYYLPHYLYKMQLSALLVVYFYLSLFTEFVFDRDYGDYRLDNILAKGSIIWRFIATIARLSDNPIFVFYAINSFLFGLLLFSAAKKNPFKSISASLIYSLYAILWWGLGQLRYGIAILLFLNVAIYTNSKLKILTITMIAGLMHTILFSSAFVYLISTIKRRKIQLYIILGIVACSVYLYPNEEALLMSLVNFLEIVGYENYAGWIYNDSTSTWAKVLAVGGACFISFIKNKKVLWIFMTITIVFLVLSLNPLFAGRVYTLYIGAIVPMFLSQVQRIKYQTKIILISAYIFEIYILFFSDDVLLDLKLLFA